MITPAFGLTATERVLQKLALDFTTAALDARVTVTRTTNATNPATYINSSGVITAATNNQPRFDYDPVTLLCKGLLIEESRANLLLNTDLLATQIVTVTAAARILSFYGTGGVTLSGAHIAVVSGTGAYPTRTTYSFTPSAGALTLTVTGTVQFAQLELGAFATSYIPTTTTSLTRNADAVSMTGTNFSSWYNQSEGAFVFDFGPFNMSGVMAGQTPYDTAIGAVTNGVRAGRTFSAVNLNGWSSNTRLGTPGTSGTISGSSALAPVTGPAPLQKLAIFQSSTALGGVVNGGTVTSVTVTVAPTGAPDMFYINERLNGYIRQIRYYNIRLTNAEVQAFSK